MDPVIAQQTASGSGGDHGAPKDPTTIVKGKRTKRQRSTASFNAFTTTTTTEDEDTANCLILLSKGQNVAVSPINNNNTEEFSVYKFNSKRYIQTTSTGIFVYECKTCSRTFSSFQALGGHRASHYKKPTLIINEFHKPKPFSGQDDHLALQPKKNYSSSLSLQLNHRVSSQKSSSKFHECSICGAQFNSGQALGGHMRRHRAANGNTTTISAAVTATNTTLSLLPYSYVTDVVADEVYHDQKSRNDGLCLDLDLNLPAPPETTGNQDQNRESGFKFTANQSKQQPSVHLSAAPTLVDCHY